MYRGKPQCILLRYLRSTYVLLFVEAFMIPKHLRLNSHHRLNKGDKCNNRLRKTILLGHSHAQSKHRHRLIHVAFVTIGLCCPINCVIL